MAFHVNSWIAAVAMISTLLCCCKDPKQKNPPSTNRPEQNPRVVPAFDGKRAFDYLIAQTEFGPRNPGSLGHQLCLAYLAKELRGYSDALNEQQFLHLGYEGEQLRLTNIIASFNLSATRRILLCAHWDTRPRSDEERDPSKRNLPVMGANDGASGVSVLLELARLLKQNPPPIGIDIVLFDGEDYGKEGDLDRYCLGSKFFATNKKVDYNPIFGILLDMVGDRNLRMPKEGYSVQYAPDIVDLIWSVASEKGITQFLDEVSAPVYDDHRSLNLIGIKTVDLIDADLVGNHGTNEGRKYWHTRQDTPDKCSVESLEAIGRVLAHIVYAKVDA